MHNRASPAQGGNLPIEGAGTIDGEGNDIGLFRQDFPDRLTIVDIECRNIEPQRRAQLVDQKPHPIEADPALVHEQMKAEIVDLKMPSAGNQLLELNLLAGDGNELGQRLFSRWLHALRQGLINQLMAGYHAVNPPSMTRLAPVI